MNLQIERVFHEPRKIDMEQLTLRCILNNHLDLEKKNPLGLKKKGQIIYKGKTVKLVSGFTTTYKEREAKAFLKIHLQIWTTGCWLPWGGVGGMGETD